QFLESLTKNNDVAWENKAKAFQKRAKKLFKKALYTNFPVNTNKVFNNTEIEQYLQEEILRFSYKVSTIFPHTMMNDICTKYKETAHLKITKLQEKNNENIREIPQKVERYILNWDTFFKEINNTEQRTRGWGSLFQRESSRNVEQHILDWDDKSNELERWQHEVTELLLLSATIPELVIISSFQLLCICNDLTNFNRKTDLLSFRKTVRSIMSSDMRNILSEQFVNEILTGLESEELKLARMSFINRCLNITTLTFPIHQCFYKLLFVYEPFTFASPIIWRIFLSEYDKYQKEGHQTVFFDLLRIPEIVLNLPDLKVINDLLKGDELDSPIVALCCDIIQKTFFAQYELNELHDSFPDAVNSLCTNIVEVEPLQYISAIALLKEYVRAFCDVNKTTLREYILTFRDTNRTTSEAEMLFNWSNRSNNNIFLKKNDLVTFAGVIAARLHFVRGSREWTSNETRVFNYLTREIENMNAPSMYKEVLKKLILNSNSLVQLLINNEIGPNNNEVDEFLMKSVIVHLIILHASIPNNASPLAAYLHNLQVCENDFILACPSDVEGVVMNAVASFRDEEGAADGVVRYRCKCGEIFVVLDCGGFSNPGEQQRNPKKKSITSKCLGLGCERVIGYGSNADDYTRMDTDKIKSVSINHEPGYIVEQISTEKTHNVRMMTPQAYRILHLFVHTLLGASVPSSIATNFFAKNGNSAGKLQEIFLALKSAFEDFEESWNAVAPHVKRYNCLQFEEFPRISLNSSVMFGLGDDINDFGIYLWAILSYLIRLQNNFLEETISIPFGSCHSLKFLENNAQNTPSTSTTQNARTSYYLQKVDIHAFPYYGEMFSRVFTIFTNFKDFIVQEPLPATNIDLLDESYSSKNVSKMVPALEMLICSVDCEIDGETSIENYISQQMDLPILTENTDFCGVLRTNLRLKHLISLYERVESMKAYNFDKLNAKYKKALPQYMERQILNVTSFTSSRFLNQIYSCDLLIALKRFLDRYLMVEILEHISTKHKLTSYITNEELSCWPSSNTLNIAKRLFLSEIQVDQTYSVYKLISSRQASR
ncbi:17759_t:CDS:2, partial [Gigaspora rosea]